MLELFLNELTTLELRNPKVHLLASFRKAKHRIINTECFTQAWGMKTPFLQGFGKIADMKNFRSHDPGLALK